MRRITLVFLVGAMLLATGIQAAEYYTKHKGDHRRAEPEEGMALVYVFRPATVGGAIKTWTFADKQLIGVSKPRGYYFAQVEPGTRIIWAKAENTSALEVELEAGKTYYFKTSIRMGLNKARVKLVQVDEGTAEEFFKKCSFCEVSESGRARGAEIAANRFDRAQKKVGESPGEEDE